MFMSPQIKNSTFGLYRYFRTLSRFFINWLKSLVGALHKLNIINLDDLVCSSMAEISKSFLYIYVKYKFCSNMGLYKQKYKHLSSVDF